MRFLEIVFQIHFLMSVGGLFEIPGDTYQKSYLSNLLAKHSPQILVGR